MSWNGKLISMDFRTEFPVRVPKNTGRGLSHYEAFYFHELSVLILPVLCGVPRAVY